MAPRQVCDDVQVQGLREWTLLGEYCGVLGWRSPPTKGEEEGDDDALIDPAGLGPILSDKVSDLAYTAKASPAAAAGGKLLGTSPLCLLQA